MRVGGPLLDDPGAFHDLLAQVVSLGFAEDDLEWSERATEPETPERFAEETIFVICNSGMHNRVARAIYEKCLLAIADGRSVSTAFGHKGKAAAIDDIWSRRAELLEAYLSAPDKIAFCRTIPWIGGITCYHLAKNFGVQVAKPDVHLARLASRHSCDAQTLCEILAERTGLRVASVDLVLWRACAERIIDPSTALPRPPPQPARPAPAWQHPLFGEEQIEMFGDPA